MSKKFSAQRKLAFLTFLSQTGNVTLSAERAKVSRSWVRLRRSTDAGFDAECWAALAAARETLSKAPSPQPSPAKGGGSKGWNYFDGHELVVRGTGGAGGGKRVQIGRARLKQWTPRAETRFLSALAATCNVKAACAEVELWPSSAYAHRERWPAFAERWGKAIALGFLRIEAALIENGCNLFSHPEFEPDIRLEGMTVADALEALRMHKHAVHGIGGQPGRKHGVASSAEIAEALRRRIVSFTAWQERQARL